MAEPVRDTIRRSIGQVRRGDAPARTRESFVYLEPDPDDPDFAQCVTCHNWIEDQKLCHLFSDDDEVDADDSCDFYVQGEPGEEDHTVGLVTPEQAGFVEGPVRCENCVSLEGRVCGLFRRLNEEMPEVFDLDEKVEPRGCCNAFVSAEPAPEEEADEEAESDDDE